MSRDIDRLLDYVRDIEWLPPVHRQVVIDRIDVGPPTDAELRQAEVRLEQERARHTSF